MEKDPLNCEHNEKKCSICKCPNKKWVELDFLNWLSPDQIIERHPTVSRDDFFPHFYVTGLVDKKFLDKKKMCLAVITRGIELLDHLAAKAPAEVVKLLPKMVQLAAELDGEIKRATEVNKQYHYHLTEQKREERLQTGVTKMIGNRIGGTSDN